MTDAELWAAYEEADRLMKASDGHQYITILKTRCQHCGRSRQQKGRCRGWFQTFLADLATVLSERGVVTADKGNER
jgi:hypothetical protein